MTIEERIQELRKGKGLSQEQLADVLGVSRQAVSKWESGQSLPEIEKLIAMSALFGVTIDYILKGETPPPQSARGDRRRSSKFSAQILYAVAAMILAIGVIATLGRLSDGTSTMDIYGGLIIESVGLALLLVGIFIAGGRVINKPLFVVNILLAGVLPSWFVAQTFFRYYPRPALGYSFFLMFAGMYIVICGLIIYIAVVRKRNKLCR